MLSAICFNLDQSKILRSGNGLVHRSVKSIDSGQNLLLSVNFLAVRRPVYLTIQSVVRHKGFSFDDSWIRETH